MSRVRYIELEEFAFGELPVANIRCLTPQESYDLLEIVESRCSHGATIFCTQYETAGWYARINPNPEHDSPISEAIMDRIVHNAYEVLIDGRVIYAGASWSESGRYRRMTITRRQLDYEYAEWFRGMRYTEEAKREILKLFGTELDEEHIWTEQDICE